MKTCLICPSERSSVFALTDVAPLATLPVLGKSLVEFWLEHLRRKGVTEVRVLAADRPELVRRLVGTGARWGLSAEVVSEPRELSPDLARKKYPVSDQAGWLPAPDDMILMDHFPGQPGSLPFSSLADWFVAILAWMPVAATLNRIGVHEHQPGVWVGKRARIAPTAKLIGPCWIGEHVTVGPNSTIGPMAVLEDRVVIEADCELSGSIIGPATLVGRFSELGQSLAWGSTLVNWSTGSRVKVLDPLMMCALGKPPSQRSEISWLKQLSGIYTRSKEDVLLLWNRRRIKLP
ncbi:MAG: Nucleotidyl transferase [Pedosphaera sp.]|nr:Nucleotidyl transferase [Pedosphaera sp.]